MLKPFQRFYFFHTLCPFCHQILSAILLNHSECDHFAAPPPTTLARMTKIDSLDCWRSLLLHLSAVMLAPLQTVFNTAIKVIFFKNVHCSKMFQWLPISHRWKPRSLQWLEGPTSSISFFILWWTSHTTFFHVHFTLAITTSMLSLEHKTPLSQDLLRRVPTLRTLFSMCLCMTHSFTSSRSPYQWYLTQLLCMNYSLHILCFSSLHIIYHLLIYHIPLNFVLFLPSSLPQNISSLKTKTKVWCLFCQ